MSQLDLACEAEISTRHLSFLETGRSQPSREMVLRLADELEIPLRERNDLLVAAGYAPVYSQSAIQDPPMEAARKAVELILTGHEPYPALAVDRHWNLVMANRVVPLLMAGADATLLQPPVNVLRLSLHPQGLAGRIVNLGQWRAHLLARLRRQVEVTADGLLVELLRELSGYPAPDSAVDENEFGGVVVPFQLDTESGVLSFFGTTTVFGTPVDITLSELAVESFFPADEATARTMRGMLPG